MLRNNISSQIKEAMKAQEKERLEALRYLWSLIQNAEIDEKGELGDDKVIKIVQTEVKKRKEAVEQMRKGGRDELVKTEEAKIKVLEAFLPEQMGEEEIEKIVDEVMSRGEKDFGKIMGQVMAKLKGKADGKMVGEIVKKKLSR